MSWNTTFLSDFQIADVFGIEAVKDTFNRVFNEWKDDAVYVTELCVVMNLLCWHHYEIGNVELSKLYSDYYYQVRDYALDHLKGDDFQYFWAATD